MRLPLISLLSGLCLLNACSAFLPEQTIQVLLPAPPSHWQAAFPRLAWKVSARRNDGAMREVVTDDWRRPVRVECARAVNAPILAWPFVADAGASPGVCSLGAGALCPAGGLFPLSLRTFQGTDVVELSWEDGPLALVVDRLAACGRDTSRFNAARLRRYLREEGDPWTVGLDVIAQKIAQGDFTAWDLDLLPLADVEVQPGPGTWFLESPFCRPQVAREGSIRLSGVPRGSHRLFSLGGSCWRLDVEEETTLLLPMQ